MAQVGSLLVKISADLSDLDKGLNKAAREINRAGAGFQRLGKTLTRNVTLPIIAVGAAAAAAANAVDKAYAAIRSGTGATGDALIGLQADFRAVFRQVPQSAEEVGRAIADLNTRTGATGATLQFLARQMLDLARITGEDVSAVIRTSTRLFGDWGVAIEDQGAALDAMFRISQTTGVGVSKLADVTTTYGVQLRALGLSLEEATAMLGQWEREGVAAEKILSGLSIGTRKFAEMATKNNTTVAAEFLRVRDAIANASEAQAIQTAATVFGSRAASDMALAIREGRLRFEDFAAAARNGTDSISKAALETMTFGDHMGILKNQVTLALQPLGVALIRAFNNMQPSIERAINLVARLTEGFSSLGPKTQGLIIGVAGLTAALGPLLVLLGAAVKGFAIAKVAILALSGPIGLSILAVGALIAAGVLLVKNWETIKAFVKGLYDTIREYLVGRFEALAERVKRIVGAVTGFFKGMYDRVVGNSYVPDMIRGIDREFSKLDSVMRAKVVAAVHASEAAFRSFATGSISDMQRVVQVQEDLQSRIKALRFDQALALTATEAARVADQIAEAEARLARANALAEQFGAALAFAHVQAKGIAQIQMPGIGSMPRPQIAPAGAAAEGGGLFAGLREAFDAFIEGLTESSQASRELASKYFGGLQKATHSLGTFLRDAGGKMLSGLSSVGTRLLSMFNPLTIASTMLDQAFRTSAESMEPLMEAVGEIAAAMGEALKPVVEALVPIFRELAPIIAAVGQILGALFKALAPILGAIVPLLRALFPVFKFVAIIATYMGQAFAKAAQIILAVIGGVATAVGTIIKGIFGALAKIPIIGRAFKPLANFGQGIIDAGKAASDMSKAFGAAFTELGKAREEIKAIEIDDPADEAVDALDAVSDAAYDAADALHEVAGTKRVSAAGPAGAEASAPAAVTVTVNIQSLTALDPEEAASQLEPALARAIDRALGGTGARSLRLSGALT